MSSPKIQDHTNIWERISRMESEVKAHHAFVEFMRRESELASLAAEPMEEVELEKVRV